MVNSITSNDLIPIEQHFRVSAGPGAGKTHWLVNHIRNVLHTSLRLGKTRKIACITYTNIAVSTILSRLTTSSDKVEVSTIHSFLYKHVVKPYVKFIATDYGLNIQKTEGHDDTILSNYSFLAELKKVTKQQRITDDHILIDAISNAKWKFNSNGILEVKTDYPRKIGNYSIKNDTYLQYKKMAWERGVIHHDDVLFFSYQLLVKFPFILNVLRAKFPYYFIDEFQDSNPIQVQILKMIGQEETKIGIIGDKAQSIYGFQGADASQFEAFAIGDIVDYQILDNRRSTNQIIDCLNVVRSGLQQNKYKNIEGNIPCIVVGDITTAYNKAKKLSLNEPVHTLSYKNVISNAMKRDMNSGIPDSQLFSLLSQTDSNKDRRLPISTCIKATEFAMQNRFKDAIKELERLFKNQKEQSKKQALKCLIILRTAYNEYSNGSMLDYHAFIDTNIMKIPKLIKGKIKDFYTSYTYEQMAVCVNIIDDDSIHRTIHKSKGDEFDNVMLILENEQDLDFILSPDLDAKEEHRVRYVAISRAKFRLYISTPTLSLKQRVQLNKMPFIIEDL